MRFPCSYAQNGLYLIYLKASSKIKEVCKIAVIKILCNDTNIHGRNTGAYVHMHTYIQAHARTRTRLILNLYCITSTSEMLPNVTYKFTCANCNKLKPELNKQVTFINTRFFYKNTKNGARLDVLSISRFQSLKMFLKCS